MDYEFTAEENRWLDAANDARSRGDREAFKKFMRLVPIHPVSAKAVKEQFGAEYLIKEGLNLKWANMEFGDDWLNR